MPRHAAPELRPPPARAVGDTATAIPAGDRRRVRTLLLLALACAALLIAAPVAIVMSPSSPDPAGQQDEAPTPAEVAVAPPAAPLPDGTVPPVPGVPGPDPAAGTSPADPAAAGSGWTQPRTSQIQILPSSPPSSSNQRPATQPPADQQTGVGGGTESPTGLLGG